MRKDSTHAGPPLHISLTHVGEAMVFSLAGQINETGADMLSNALDEVLEAQVPAQIVFDIGNVSFMGSTGLGQMMRAYRAAKEIDGSVQIVNPQPLVADLFRLTKLDRLLEIHATLEEALDEPIDDAFSV